MFQVNREELEALYGYDEFLFKLYFAGIRRYMDYSTGMVGIKRGVSWYSLQETMRVDSKSGVKEKLPHESKVRRAVKTLERIGLIKKKTRGNRLIFECFLATTDKSVQTKAGTQPDTLLDRVSRHPTKVATTYSYRSNKQKPDTEPDTPKSAEADTPPLSVKKKRTITNVIVTKEKLSTDIPLPSWLPEDTWDDYVAFRKEIKKPLTTRAKQLCLRQLEKFKAEGQNPAEVINQSIMNGWQGLFAVKGDSHGKPQYSSPAGRAIDNILNGKFDVNYD